MIRPGCLFLSGSLLMLAAHAVDADTSLQRYTLIVGANFGGADRPVLKYGVSDAERFARVMVDLGGVSPEHNTILRQPKLRDLLDGFDMLTRRVADAARLAGSGALLTEVIVYYSGHADEKGLLLGEDRYSYRSLRDRLDQIPADVRIVVLDACASGAFTRIKADGRVRRFSWTSPPACVVTPFSPPAPQLKWRRSRTGFARRTSPTTSSRACAAPPIYPATGASR
jgi:Caspase domain